MDKSEAPSEMILGYRSLVSPVVSPQEARDINLLDPQG